MKLIEVKDYNEMSQKAAEYIIEKVRNYPRINLGLATGGTPVGTYKILIEDHQKNGTSYQEVTTFNLDEYIGLSGNNPNSYRYFMNEKLFNHLDINKNNTFIPSGVAKDIQAECLRYEQLITQHGGVDLQLLGIGQNGHIGFNEPGTSFQSNTHVVDLAPSTIKANARFFDNEEEVPTKAITMGIATIMKSKEILLLVSGESKNDAMHKLWNGEVTESFPASILKNHPYVTIIADQAAVAGLKMHS
ncbi:glucosamine-6-phosphate deaminase [Bacillus thermocopriae]|uniref:Glucosamine-6-phosphate deaminase n=1 Tax=Neobacillus thermocopriae TaxID=1215031 RepID=A0A6B3TSD8_9BACI|nr:glucosamine-6-phosphate deaminase [Neobacillus thermocopriae]MED3622979.1 glucosamine-6-phosphate deaminase [Neobacillus thermocopriae]MED3714874.1 glucosamine-6-phosphate deaminase [Neobacillus thermocopriae]NEX79269.1 glucosamine-6-phosphate deaminase [Neobacillus thermocopriae]